MFARAVRVTDKRWGIVAVALVCQLALSRPALSANETAARRSYAQGLFLYRNDDITDKAASELRTAIKLAPGSRTAQSAQYYLGSYYQRKFYVMRRRYGKTDTPALDQAAKYYGDYTNQYGKSKTNLWLSDARFNLALVLLQKADLLAIGKGAGRTAESAELVERAKGALNALRSGAAGDPKVYIYKVIWSEDPSDVLDDYFDAPQLAGWMISFLSTQRDPAFAEIVKGLKQFCRDQKTAIRFPQYQQRAR